jgi:hypothetical protein
LTHGVGGAAGDNPPIGSAFCYEQTGTKGLNCSGGAMQINAQSVNCTGANLTLPAPVHGGYCFSSNKPTGLGSGWISLW